MVVVDVPGARRGAAQRAVLVANIDGVLAHLRLTDDATDDAADADATDDSDDDSDVVVARAQKRLRHAHSPRTHTPRRNSLSLSLDS